MAAKMPLILPANPLVYHHLRILRDKNMSGHDYRKSQRLLGQIMVHEAAKFFPTSTSIIDTPMQDQVEVPSLHDLSVANVPVFGAGIGFADGFQDLDLPGVNWQHRLMAYERDEKTLRPTLVWCRSKEPLTSEIVLVGEPMCATGGSGSLVCTDLKHMGARNIIMMHILATQEGIDQIQADHPDVQLVIAAIDPKLNDVGYIVPGLGDAGDRMCGC